MAPFASLRPSFWIQPQYFSIIYQKIVTIHPADVFFSFFGQNGLECDSMWNYRRLTRKLNLPHIPENVIPGDFNPKKRKNKKNGKKEKTRSTTTILWSAKILQSAWILQYVYVPLWSAMSHVECEEIMECEEFWVFVAGIETTEGNFGARTKIPIPKPAQTPRGTP